MTKKSPKADLNGPFVFFPTRAGKLDIPTLIRKHNWNGLTIKLYLVQREGKTGYLADVWQGREKAMSFAFDPPIAGNFGSAVIAPTSPIDLAEIMQQVCAVILQAVQQHRDNATNEDASASPDDESAKDR